MQRAFTLTALGLCCVLALGCSKKSTPTGTNGGATPTDSGGPEGSSATANAENEGTQEEMEANPEIGGRESAGMGAAHPPEKVVGAESCAECHEQEGEVWRASTHFTSFDSMPQSEKAQEIAQKMGVEQITGDGACVKCHFTRQTHADGTVFASSGVSCESCHGAAADWLDVHHDYGDGNDRRTETMAHRQERMQACDAAGMIRPERLYDVALNCYECHTIPNEKLINEGGHPTGSEFELVSRYQVEIRHNFFASDGERNDPAPGGLHPLFHMREMHVVGRFLDLEMTLRALEKATESGPYLDYLTARFNSLVGNLKEIQEKTATDIPEITEALAVVEGLELKAGQADVYNKAAHDVTTQGREFAWKMYGDKIAEVDQLIPSEYKGKELPKIRQHGGMQSPGQAPGNLPPPPGVDPSGSLPPPG